MPPFRDRAHAGRLLGERLRRAGIGAEALVLGLPRGGVPVAAEVAAALMSDLDVLVVRKLALRRAPEVAIGALGEDGVEVIRVAPDTRGGPTAVELADAVARERAELERRLRIYRRDRPPRRVEDRTVVVVDDGIATGASAEAAIEVLRVRGAARIVVAAPVAGPAAARRLDRSVDELVVLVRPDGFRAVGAWYDDFRQVDDDEVHAALARRG